MEERSMIKIEGGKERGLKGLKERSDERDYVFNKLGQG